MATDGHMSPLAQSNDATLLECTQCDGRWHDRPDAPCWFCGDTGTVAHPQRLVLD